MVEPVPQCDPYLTPKQVARLKGVHVFTVLRWMKKGVKVGPRGNRLLVKLAAYKVGGFWRISPEAMGDFDRATNAVALGQGRRIYQPYRTRHRNRHAAAMANLKALGV